MVAADSYSCFLDLETVISELWSDLCGRKLCPSWECREFLGTSLLGPSFGWLDSKILRCAQ